jgi:hypothetical protein
MSSGSVSGDRKSAAASGGAAWRGHGDFPRFRSAGHFGGNLRVAHAGDGEGRLGNSTHFRGSSTSLIIDSCTRGERQLFRSRQLEKEPEPFSSMRPFTPPMLDQVIRACLAKDPADRIQTAHDVAMNLLWIAVAAPGDAAKSQRQINRAWAAGFGALFLALMARAGNSILEEPTRGF